MASTAGQISRDLLCFDLRRFVATFAPAHGGGAGGGLFAGEDLTARALAGAGLASLFALPLLLLSSALFGAPLAVPAAIGLGYLAVSHALAARHRRRADFINAVVLCGLVGWLLIFLLVGEGPLSHAGLVAALLAPIFAAAPAFARSFMSARRVVSETHTSTLRDSALERVACLDELTPMEQVLVIDSNGTVLAATAAARKALWLLPDAFEHHVNSLFEADDLTRVLGALDRCIEGGKPVGLERAPLTHRFSTREGGGGGAQPLQTGAAPTLAATFSPCSDGSVAMRLQDEVAVTPAPISTAQEAVPCRAVSQSAKLCTRPRCDIGEAMAFALRHSKPKAKAKSIALTSEIEPSLAIACDKQAGRRTVGLLVDAALSGSPPGSVVTIVARRLKSVVLLRASSKLARDVCESSESDDRFDITALRLLVEGAGGTLVVDRDGNEIALSVRLDLAPERLAQQRMEERAKAA
jgi:hypothetical protein